MYSFHYLEFSIIILLKALILKVDFQRIKVLIHRNTKKQYIFMKLFYLVDEWISQHLKLIKEPLFVPQHIVCISECYVSQLF